MQAAVEGAVVALAGYFLATRVWNAAPDKRGILVGAAAAWAASSVSVAWLIWARGREMKIFWRAFGGGMALRVLVLLALAVGAYGKEGLSYEGVLISYVFALLALMLTLEMRHLKIR